MKTYKPRRATKRWLEGAPEYILDCFKDVFKGGNYWVLFGGTLLDPFLLKDKRVHMLELNDMPTHPCLGVSRCDTAKVLYRPAHLRVRWLDLPENVREHIIMKVNCEI